MPTARAATRRSVAGPSGSEYGSSPVSSATSSPLTPADHHLLRHVNNMRKCCDMTMFCNNVSEQGTDFITDSIVHARQVFATYATSSLVVASPSKLAAELLKSPTRTRTRSKAATTRSRAPFASNADPFSECIDITDKENAQQQQAAPLPGRAKRGRGQKADEPSEVVRSTRSALTDAKINNEPTEPIKKNVSSKQSKVSRHRPRSSQDDSMADDASAAAVLDKEDDAPPEVPPRASTPPLTVASPPAKAETLTDLDAISVFDSDNEDSFADLPSTKAQSSRDSDTVLTVQNDLTYASSSGDKTQASDHTTSSSRLDSAQQAAAAALLVSKLAQQQNKDSSVDKPVKRTLASYGANKKSLSTTVAAAHNARASVTLQQQASTPAASFRSSFLNKSLRKQIADQQALDNDSDDDDDDSDNDSDDQMDHQLGPTKATTQANTRANATIVTSASRPSKKRKSDDPHEVTSTATVTVSSDATGLCSPRSANNKAPKLADKTKVANAPTLSSTAGANKPQQVVGPASKLEQFRSNLAHVTRTTDSSSTSTGSTSSQHASFTSANSSAKGTPTSPVTRSSAKAAAANVAATAESVASDSSAETTERLANRSGESTVKASAIPRSPVRSPSRIGQTSPIRPPPPPRSGSVRSPLRNMAEPSTDTEHRQQTVVRAASPTRLRGANPFHRATGSPPPPQTRSIAALFNSPKQSSKLPQPVVSTTPANSPPKALQLGKVPFPTSSSTTGKQNKPLPSEPVTALARGATPRDPAVRVPSAATSSVRAVSEVLQHEDDAFFDADEGGAIVNDMRPKSIAVPVSQPIKSGLASKAAPTASPKKATGKTAVPASPAKSPSRTGTLRGLTASPGKSRAPAAGASASPSRAWGLGDKIKGFLGLHANNNTTPAATAASASSAQTSKPSSTSITVHQQQQSQPARDPPTPAVEPASRPETKQVIPNALLASPAAKLAPSATAVQSTPTSATTLVGGKPASLARAELLRKKQAEEEERKAKEKEERRKMLLAKKEERAKAVAEEEMGKESKKRLRDGGVVGPIAAGGRLAPAAADQSTASAASSSSVVVIPSALLGGGSVGGVGNTSRVSTVSVASSNGSAASALTRPSSAMNGSYASVKSRYMQTSSINAPTMPSASASIPDSNKKRRLTAEKQQQHEQTSGAVGTQVRTAVGNNVVAAPPKLNRTVSQTSIRPPHTQQPPGSGNSQASVPHQQTKFASAAAVVVVKPTTSVTSASGFPAPPRTTAPPLKQAPQPSQVNRHMPNNANFSSANPFQQAKQQQLQQQQQQQQQQQLAKQKQMQQAALLREQELHRAAQKQFQAQHAHHAVAGAAGEDADDSHQQAGEEEALPDIASEYSDSEDEETIQKRAAMPAWTQGDALDAALLAQSTVDADEIFGIPQGPVELDKILPGERTLNRIRRPRSSSANWSGQDGLAQWEIDRYNKRMGIKAGLVQLGSTTATTTITQHAQAQPPPLARISIAANRSSTSTPNAVFLPSSLSHSTQPPIPSSHRKA